MPSLTPEQENPMPRSPEDRDYALACLKEAAQLSPVLCDHQAVVAAAKAYFEFVTGRAPTEQGAADGE